MDEGKDDMIFYELPRVLIHGRPLFVLLVAKNIPTEFHFKN